MRTRLLVRAGLAVTMIVWAGAVRGDDWPMWRGDAARTGVSPEELPREPRLQWVSIYPALETPWPDEERMTFDTAYEPVVSGSRVYFGSSWNDALTCLDAETGGELWRFYAGGPIRFAPAVYEGNVYFSADDGYLYAVDAGTGAMAWKFRGAPSGRKVLGNKRLISPWPARGAPVVADGIVYFAAGIWSFEGIFLYALDAKTGNVLWSNDNCDVPFMVQPHRSPAFAGVTPQGYLAVSGEKLLVPSGRAVAACFERGTGQLAYFDLEPNNRHGGYRVSAAGNYFFNPNALYELDSGKNLGDLPGDVAVSKDTVVVRDEKGLRAYDLDKISIQEHQDAKGKSFSKFDMPLRWNIETESSTFIVAGKRVYAGKPGEIFAIEPPSKSGDAKIKWRAPIEGTPQSIVAANGRLIAATQEGRIYCFAEAKRAAVTNDRSTDAADAGDARAAADDALRATGVRDGYALVFAAPSPEFVIALARQSALRVIAVEPRAEDVEKLRRVRDAYPTLAGRVAALEGSADSLDIAPYLASLIVCGADAVPKDAAALRALFEMLRPYGGVACLTLPAGADKDFEASARSANLANFEVSQAGGLTLLRRVGPLPGAADWTHQYADSSNTAASQDDLVRLPLGLLWFGGSSNIDVLPRHGHGPSEQIVDGRLIIEGPDELRALDVYTGRLLWKAELAGLGTPFDNVGHQPGASARGSNYVSTHDAIYVAHEDRCLRLAPDTGAELGAFTLPVPEGATAPPAWGYLGIWEDLLIAGSGPVVLDEEVKGKTWNAISSKRIVALDRNAGTPLWTCAAQAAFRHNAIALGGAKVFCIDAVTAALLEHMKRRGIDVDSKGRLFALDARTGAVVWSASENIFGTWLGYSEPHDILLQAGRRSRDMLEDEPGDRMIAYRGADGSVLWDKKVTYDGPCMLLDDRIIAQEQFFDLRTGEPILAPNPLTGVPMTLRWSRNHGCNSAIASRHLVTFRSAAAGFFDLDGNGGTGNWGGFRSGCTSNLVAADGVLNAPDYTRTCTCSYQNQTSLALVHNPAIETWTFNDWQAGEDRVRRVGINLGAPGDRRDGETLWLEYPVVGGPSPELPIEAAPENVTWFRRHSARMQGGGLEWVAASGGKGLARLSVTLCKNAKDEAPYTVRLYFAEPDAIEPGARVFDVSVQGALVLDDFDIVRDAGGPMRTLTREFPGVRVRDALTLTFEPKSGCRFPEPVLCGVEAIQE